MTSRPGAPHLPRLASIDGYGRGGFRFAGMSHRGSLLCLPSGIWGWPPARAEAITRDTLEPLIAEAGSVDMFLIGVGATSWIVPHELRAELAALGVAVDAMRTGSAVSTFNILLGERRRVAAGLIATD